MNAFGYVRVSDASQNEDRQMISMAEQGVPAKNIYVDKQSGKQLSFDEVLAQCGGMSQATFYNRLRDYRLTQAKK